MKYITKASAFPIYCTCTLIGVLGLAISFIWIVQRKSYERKFIDGLGSIAAAPRPGWERKYQPLAETEELRAVIKYLLNHSDSIYARYTYNKYDRIDLYIGYWAPGQMSQRLVAGHVPDVCWVASGWECLATSVGNDLHLVPSIYWRPQERIMRKNNHDELVYFWHIVDGKPVYYPFGGPKWHAMFTDLFLYKFNLRPEQLFIRISMPLPVDKNTTDMLDKILSSLNVLRSKPV